MLAGCHGLLAQAADTSTFWLPSRASTVSERVDGLFYFVYWVNVVFFLLIAVMTVGFVLRYRHRKGQSDDIAKGAAHSTALELTWTVVPTLIVIVIFYYGFRGFLDLTVAPNNAMEILVTGKMWNWEFTYPNGHVDTELHVPKDVPVRFVLQSADVIHSFFVPNFRIKKDVVPGRYNKEWAQATVEGTFPIYCAEYCGTNHSRMRAEVVVQNQDAYNKWLAIASDPFRTHSPVEVGQMYYRNRGCMQCHSIDGSRIIGPSFRDLFGREETMRDGQKVQVDENYVRESILEPSAKVVASFDPVMPSFKGSLNDKDINAICEYLKSISKNYHGPMLPTQVGETGAQTTKPGSSSPEMTGPAGHGPAPTTAPAGK